MRHKDHRHGGRSLEEDDEVRMLLPESRQLRSDAANETVIGARETRVAYLGRLRAPS